MPKKKSSDDEICKDLNKWCKGMDKFIKNMDKPNFDYDKELDKVGSTLQKKPRKKKS